MKKLWYTLTLIALIVATITTLCSNIKFKYEKIECYITMRDSVRLHTTIYKPRWGCNHPILVERTPYSSAPYGPEFTNAFSTSYRIKEYAKRDYILVFQDVRGRFMSEGEYENVRPGSDTINEMTDTYDTVEWLVANVEGNNGRVGFAGCSYPGFYAMYAGASNHPAIKAVCPQAPVTDWFMGDDIHHNGVMMINDSFSFMPVMSHTDHTPTTEWESTREHDYKGDIYTYFLNASRDSLHSVMHPSKFWDDMSSHPNYDEWWQNRNVRQYLYNINPAVLVVGGLFDAEDCFGAWNTYKALRSQSPQTDCRLVVGPWAHGAWNNQDAHLLGDFNFGDMSSNVYYADNFEIPFFEYHLRGKGTLDCLPQVSVFISGSNEWHTSDCWTSAEAEKLCFYLDNQTLTTNKPTTTSSLTYTSDPSNPVPFHSHMDRRHREYMIADQRFTDGRTDVLTYTAASLDSDLTLIGEVTVNLDVAMTTTDADFVVRIIDTFPSDDPQKPDYQMLVRADIMRARYRDSFTTPSPVVPNTTTRISFTMPDIAHTFKQGHTLRVCVQSSWYPLAERSPQQFVDLWHCTSADFIPSDITIFNSSTIEFNTL